MSSTFAAWRCRAGGVILAALLVFGKTQSAQSSESLLPAAPEGLRTAVAAAWERSPHSTAVAAVLDAASERATAASQPLYNPELEVNADDEGPDRTLTTELSMPLDLSGKRQARSSEARATLDAATAEARLRRRDFAQAWLVAWAETTAANRRVELGARRVALLERFADLAERQLKVGDVTTLDRDLALLARDEAGAEQASLLADRAAAQEARRRLDTGVEGAHVAFPAASALPSATAAPPDVATLPEWTLAQTSAEVARAGVDVAERNRIADPTLKLRGGTIELADGAHDGMYGMSISIPLFVRNSFRAEVLAARADARAAAADLARVKLELQARAERATVAYGAVNAAWLQWQRSPATNVDERANLLERLWRAGEMSTSDYLLQVNQTLDTALAGAALEGRLWTTCTDYLAATGQLEEWLGLAAQKDE